MVSPNNVKDTTPADGELPEDTVKTTAEVAGTSLRTTRSDDAETDGAGEEAKKLAG